MEGGIVKKFIRKYKTAKKVYNIGDPVDIKDEKILNSLLKNGTIKEFGDGKNPLEKRIEELEAENESLKSSQGDSAPLSFTELSKMTVPELDGLDEKLEIKTTGNKAERAAEIWAKLSEGYEAK